MPNCVVLCVWFVRVCVCVICVCVVCVCACVCVCVWFVHVCVCMRGSVVYSCVLVCVF